MAKAVGIALGTTNSVVSVMEGGKPIVTVNSEAAVWALPWSPSPILARGC